MSFDGRGFVICFAVSFQGFDLKPLQTREHNKIVAFQWNEDVNTKGIMMGFGPKQSFLTCKNVSTENFSQLQDSQSNWYLNDDEEPATHKGHTMLQVKMHVSHGQNYGAAYSAIINQCFFSYASWPFLFQAVALSYAKQVVKLMDSVLMARKATVEVNNKELNTLKIGASLLHKTVSFTYMRCCHHMLL